MGLSGTVPLKHKNLVAHIQDVFIKQIFFLAVLSNNIQNFLEYLIYQFWRQFVQYPGRFVQLKG